MHTQGPGQKRWYVHDHLYSTVALTGWWGDVQERYEYDAYGNCTIWDAGFTTERQTSNYGNPYLFTSRRVDILDSGSLKIQYNRHRYYDDYTGRFTTHDSLGINPAGRQINPFAILNQYKGGLNLYEYLRGNPTRRTDPMGLIDICSGFCHFCFRYGDVVIDDDHGLPTILAQEIKSLPSIRLAVARVKEKAKKAMAKLGRKMGCPRSYANWHYNPRPKLHHIPWSHPGLRHTLGHFTLYHMASCAFQKICCSKKCQSLPVDPCGKVKGRCRVQLHAHDYYDFHGVLSFLNFLGKNYYIDVFWSEQFEVGPATICGSERKCNKR